MPRTPQESSAGLLLAVQHAQHAVRQTNLYPPRPGLSLTPDETLTLRPTARGGTIANMQSPVKLVCEGVSGQPHSPRTVAQFRHDGDGWARVHNEGPHDPLLWMDGEVVARHALSCDRCSYDGYFKPEKLYPLLDEARTRGWMPVPR